MIKTFNTRMSKAKLIDKVKPLISMENLEQVLRRKMKKQT